MPTCEGEGEGRRSDHGFDASMHRLSSPPGIVHALGLPPHACCVRPRGPHMRACPCTPAPPCAPQTNCNNLNSDQVMTSLEKAVYLATSNDIAAAALQEPQVRAGRGTAG